MRKTREIVIDQPGVREDGTPINRDHQRVYVLTEMSSEAAELWAARAFNGAARANVEIPESVKGSGIIGVAIMGLKMFLACDFPTVEELLRDLMTCVQYRPERDKPFTRPIVGDDIEEISTRIFLREEVIKLHTGFTLAEAMQKLISAFPELISSDTSTSQDSSAQ